MVVQKALSQRTIDDDELVEVTPTAIRVRKRVLAANQRPRTRKGAA